MKPVKIEVFHPFPDNWRLCHACEVVIGQANFGKVDSERGSEELPQEFHDDLDRLESMLRKVSEIFGEKVVFLLFDPRSLQGLIKSIRYRIHKYPGFIIDQRKKYCGWDIEALNQFIEAAGAVRQ